ncbi:MAG: hypothetical protein IT307_18860, partial [Chloroflexi bacterium]|nr:hypothetical protein [Chloroflexota bacterium]
MFPLSSRMVLFRLAALLGVLLTLVGCSGPWSASFGLSPQPLVYVAIGASDGVGVGANDPERDGWVPLLHARLPRGSRLVNLAVSGSTAAQAIEQQLPVAQAVHPDLVTV